MHAASQCCLKGQWSSRGARSSSVGTAAHLAMLEGGAWLPRRGARGISVGTAAHLAMLEGGAWLSRSNPSPLKAV